MKLVEFCHIDYTYLLRKLILFRFVILMFALFYIPIISYSIWFCSVTQKLRMDFAKAEIILKNFRPSLNSRIRFLNLGRENYLWNCYVFYTCIYK